MVKGAFVFLLFIFSNPQRTIIHKLEGYWQVTSDNTELYRKYLTRLYVFEACDKHSIETGDCSGHFGFVNQPEVFTNLLDINYIKYGIARYKSDRGKGREIQLGDERYNFVLNLNKKRLILLEPATGDTVMVLDRLRKSL